MSDKLYTTPCYILHEDKLIAGINKLKDALNEYWPNSIYGYSVKTNGLPWLVNYMKNSGFYGEVVSEDEYQLVRKLGFEPNNIIFNGPVKGKESFLEAIQTGAIVNLDSSREVEWLIDNASIISPETRIGLRVNFNIEKYCPGESSGGEDGSRFGFSYENKDWKRAFDRLKFFGIKVSGIHLHIGSHTRSVKLYTAIAKQACIMKEEYGIDFDFIDIGGGYFGGMENRPQFKDYIAAVAQVLGESFNPEKTTLIMEPGTSLCSAPFEYITTVVDVKDTYASRIVTIDGSRNDVDPLHTKKGYFLKVESPGFDSFLEGTLEDAQNALPFSDRDICKRQLVYGYTCMETDRLVTLENRQELRVGDELHIDKVGGYTMCLTPLFIKYFPRVYLERDKKLSVIREKWDADEYFMKSRLE